MQIRLRAEMRGFALDDDPTRDALTAVPGPKPRENQGHLIYLTFS